MRCTRPRTVGFRPDGKTIAWSPKHISKEYATFPLPCGKCISCRLEYARQWAVRSIHEAQMHPQNSFITLTYDDAHLASSKLIYSHFQKFQKDLRNKIFQDLLNSMFPKLNQRDQRKIFRSLPKERQKEIHEKHKISIFVTGEYGDIRKRPHWHALIFNWRPMDATYKYSNDRGDKIYSSQTLSTLWPQGLSELGQITFESAGYCARYAAKKLSHGHDKTHPYEPISKKSSRSAIGKTFIQTYWRDIFAIGKIILPNGETCGIPRYYEKWLKANQPNEYSRYVTQLKAERMGAQAEKTIQQEKITYETNMKRAPGSGPEQTQNQAREKILKQKFSNLNKFLKDL